MKTRPTPARRKPRTATADRRKILIVEDHPVFCEGLAQLINQEPDLTVCGQAENGAQALKAVATTTPDLVLVDISLPGKSGLELIKDLHVIHPEVAVLVVSMHEEMLYAERVLRAGGRGYIMKQERPESILRAIRQVLEGQIYISAKMSPRILETFFRRTGRSAQSPISQLSDREFEVLDLLGQGKDSHAIARQLNLSFKTVDAHRARIKQKLKLKSGTELICYAARWVEAQQLAGN
jgi:DNA-binding NarL/FixJ family response regulator